MIRSKSEEKPASKAIPIRVRRPTKPKLEIDGVFKISDELTPPKTSTSVSPKGNVYDFFKSNEPVTQTNQLVFKTEENYEKDCRTLGFERPIKNCTWEKTFSLLQKRIFVRTILYEDENNLKRLVGVSKGHRTHSGYLLTSSEGLVKLAEEEHTENLNMVYVIKIEFELHKNFQHLAFVQEKDKPYTYFQLQPPEDARAEEKYLAGKIIAYQKLENYPGFKPAPTQLKEEHSNFNNTPKP